MKILKLVGVVVVALIVVGLLAQDRLLKAAARRVFVEQTGFDVEIGKLNASLWKSRVEMEDIQVRNPPNFPEPVAFVIQNAAMTLDPWSLLRGETHLKELTLDVPRIVLVRNAEGETNLEQLSGKNAKKERIESTSAAAPETESVAGGMTASEATAISSSETSSRSAPKPAPPAKEGPFKIDRLALKIGSVEYHDYRGRSEPAVSEFNLNLEREGENIRSGEEIGALLVGGVMQSVVSQLFTGVGDNLKAAIEDKNFQEEVKNLGKNLKNAFKGLLNTGD